MSRDPQAASFGEPDRNLSPADPLHKELDLQYWISVAFRTAGQLLGGILLLIGVYYSLSILGQLLAAGRDPQVLEASLQSITNLLELQDAKLVVNDQTISVGRTIGFAALAVWYVITLWIPLALMGAGTKLIWGPISERRAFYNAIEEFFRTARVNDIKK